MPKRSKADFASREGPQVGDIWEDCYEADGMYVHLLLHKTEDENLWYTYNIAQGQYQYRSLSDWKIDWLRRA